MGQWKPLAVEGELGLPVLARARATVRAAFGRSSPLVLSRLASAVITFGLPLTLVRLLDPEAFGAYKQFYLVVTTLLLIGQAGLPQSLYFFLPKREAERGSYVTQALVILWPLAAVAGVVIWLGAARLSAWLGSPALEASRTPLALTAALMLAAAPLESLLTAEGRIGAAALSYALSDAVRAGALVLAGLCFARGAGPAAIFWAAAVAAGLRVAALSSLIAGRVVPAARPDRARLRAQLHFALPYAGAALLYTSQRYCAQYLVSASFGPALFALFAVASFHMPVADIVFTPVNEVLIVELGRHLGSDLRAARAAWNDAVDQLATLLFPAACGAWLLGPTVLPLLFTRRYDAAVPLFVLATLEMLLYVLPVDAVLRAAGDTRFLLGFNALRLGGTVALVLAGIRVGGLAGAIVGGVAAEGTARLVLLWRGRRFLGAGPVVDGARLRRIAFAALGAALPAWLVRHLGGPRLSTVVLATAVYVAVYVGLLTRSARPVA